MSLFHVSEEILQAQQDAGRASGSVELIAVSKVQPNDRVLAVLQQGHRVFGENRVQEAEGKWPEFQKNIPRCKGASARTAAIEQSPGSHAPV